MSGEEYQWTMNDQAVQMHETYLALRHGGFSRYEALLFMVLLSIHEGKEGAE